MMKAKILELISKMVGDTSIPASETKSDLEEIITDCEERITAIDQMAELERDSD